MDAHSSKGERGWGSSGTHFIFCQTLPTSTINTETEGCVRACNKFVKGCVEYYIFSISGDSLIQYARTLFCTNTRTIRVCDTSARIPYHDCAAYLLSM